jgi:hypothetical protein
LTPEKPVSLRCVKNDCSSTKSTTALLNEQETRAGYEELLPLLEPQKDRTFLEWPLLGN